MNLNDELHNASGNGNIIRVKLLLKLGANVNAWYNEALCWAAYNGHKDVCNLLIENGADIDNALKYIYKNSKGYKMLKQMQKELK